jgi:hypothetical protein
MQKIDFLLIGAQKSGTTTLYDWLQQVPAIFLPSIKENRYFADDEFYRQGEAWLETYYRGYAGQTVVGGAYVHLLYFPHCAERIRAYNPRMRMLTVLRDPVDRAYSAYWFARSKGWETARTFEEALGLEAVRRVGSYQDRSELTYLDHGRYARQLRNYYASFDRGQILVLLNEDLKDDRARALGDTLAFLGLDADVSRFNLSVASNVSGKPRVSWLQQLISDRDAGYRRLWRRMAPPHLRLSLRETLLKPLNRWNVVQQPYEPMKDETRQRLRMEFRADNEALADLLGRAISW